MNALSKLVAFAIQEDRTTAQMVGFIEGLYPSSAIAIIKTDLDLESELDLHQFNKDSKELFEGIENDLLRFSLPMDVRGAITKFKTKVDLNLCEFFKSELKAQKSVSSSHYLVGFAELKKWRSRISSSESVRCAASYPRPIHITSENLDIEAFKKAIEHRWLGMYQRNGIPETVPTEFSDWCESYHNVYIEKRKAMKLWT